MRRFRISFQDWWERKPSIKYKVTGKGTIVGAGTVVGTILAKHVAVGGRRSVLLARTCPPGTLTQGLSFCPQILELLCQILQTDSLSAIQFWLLHAPPKGEDAAVPRSFWK